MLDYGLEGYGLYWYCIELISNKVDQDNINFDLEHDARIIARNTGSTSEKVSKMMQYFVDIGLFENCEGVITCLKLAKRLDKSMTSNPEMRNIINSFKNKDLEMSHDSVMIKSEKVMQDKNRLDKNRLEEKKQKACKPKKKNHTTLKTYLNNCKAENVEAIPLDSIVFKNAGKIGLSNEFVNVAWFCFKAYWIEDKPRSTKADWLIAFNNCLTGDGYGTYRKNQQGEFYLTTKGKNMLEIMRGAE